MLADAKSRNRAVLGRAVHPAALDRLHELFPEARVNVEHEAHPVELLKGSMKMSRRFYQRPSHETRVFIDLDGDKRPGGTIFGTATCHHEDNFDRRKGITLAYRRALDIARRTSASRIQDSAYKQQGLKAVIERASGAVLRTRLETLKATLGAGPLGESIAYPLRRERDMIEDEFKRRGQSI
jgi:hypothetical protein